MTLVRFLVDFVSLLPLVLTSPILARDGDGDGDSNLGLHFGPNGTCTPDQRTAMQNAIADMRTLSHAALSALKTQSGSNPAAYFFPSSLYPVATSVFNSVLWATLPLDQMPKSSDQPWLNHIDLYCDDLEGLCGNPGIWGYVPWKTNAAPAYGSAEIVVCPAMLSLPRIQAPCTGTPGLANLGWAFLRTFVMLRSVQTGGFSRLERDGIADRAPGVDGSHGLLGTTAMSNADNYAELATWANDLGVNSDGISQCANQWPAAWV